MVGFVFIILTFALGVGLIIAAVAIKRPAEQAHRGQRPVPRWPFALGGVVLFLVAGFGLIGAMYASVGTSDVGIVTAFGHTQGNDLRPGPHLVAPWDDVTIWDDSVQHTVFDGPHSKIGNTGCLVVRIAGQQAACLDVNIYWRDQPGGSDRQFVLYRTFLRLQAAYMSRGVLVQFFNNRFEHFDPVDLASQTAAGKTGGQDVSALTAQVADDIRTAYAGQITILRVTTSSPSYSGQVDAALEKVVTAKANYNAALIAEKTATAQATATKNLNAQKPTTGTLLELCYQTTANILGSGGHLPAAWTCTGGGAGVLVNGGG
jgi:hypothetical protein